MSIKNYIISMLVYHLGFILCYIRIKMNKIKVGKSKENKLYIWIKYYSLSLIPILNLLFGITFLYMALLMKIKAFKEIFESEDE